jgi:hypothetical protein
MVNQAEHLFGLNPTLGSSANPVSAFGTLKTTGTFTYTRRTSTLTNAAHAIWTSTNLTTWVQDTGATQVVTSTANNIETVSVTLSASLLNSGSRYVRVQATGP